jgi:hypothetical protein
MHLIHRGKANIQVAKFLLENGIVILVIFPNLILNSFFIPFAGYYGAAFATSVSMFAYFILFGSHLTSLFKTHKHIYLIAGSSVYLTYRLFQRLALSFAVSFSSFRHYFFCCSLPSIFSILIYGVLTRNPIWFRLKTLISRRHKRWKVPQETVSLLPWN